MAEAIRMPLLSDTMKEGVIAAWHKKVGDTVKSDDVIADVETDKATMEVMPYVDGTLLYIGVEQGKGVPVNGIMAIIGKPGEDFQALLKDDGGTAQPAPKPEEKKEEPAPQPSANKEAPSQTTPPPAAPAAIPKDVTVVRMPLLSDTMKEGKIVAWHKKEGDTVKSDDVLADVETDKATMEVMGYADGTLLHVGVKEGEAAKINDIIAIIGKPGTDIQSILNSTAPPRGEVAPPASQQAASNPPPPQAQGAASPVAEPADHAAGDAGYERLKASPLARKLAQDKGIDIAQVKGSGDNGRIIKRDIDGATENQKPKAESTQQAVNPKSEIRNPESEDGFTDTPLSQMRRVIAKRLSESMYTAPHFYLRMTITMDAAIEARKAINAISPVKVSFNDIIIKACAAALRLHPEVNSSWTGESIRAYRHIHIGSAVAVDEGLIVPVIKFADTKSLSQIAQEAGGLYEKAKTKKLQPAEFTGNTFTISNLGMMDIDEFTAIINPPDSCILAVGKIAPTPVAEGDKVVIRQLLKLTLSCDHRVVDGAVGARFLQTLKRFLENPVTMLA